MTCLITTFTRLFFNSSLFLLHLSLVISSPPTLQYIDHCTNGMSTYKLATFRQPLYKLNFDGALFDSEQCAGWGVLIRNEAGQVVASLSERALLPFTAIEVEAMAARRALVLALEAGFDRVILEGDSLVLINALQNNSLCIPLRPHSKRHTVSCLFFRSTLFPST